MSDTGKTAFTVTRVGPNGKITIPPEYRSAESLQDGTPLVAIQVGDALVLAPIDQELSAVTARMESALKAAGHSIEDLIAAAAAARADVAESEFSDKAEN